VIIFGFPIVGPIDLIESNNERGLSLRKQLERLESLVFETVLEIDNQNSNITKTRASRPKVAETLVAWSINNEKSGNIDIDREEIFAFTDFFNQFILREESGTDLLSNSSCFSFLNVGLSDFIQESSFTCVDVSQDAADRASVVSHLPGEIAMIVFEKLGLFLFFFVLMECLLEFFLCDFYVFFFLVNNFLIEFELHSLLFIFGFILVLDVDSLLFISLYLILYLLNPLLLLLSLSSLPLLFFLHDPLLLLLELDSQAFLFSLKLLLLFLFFLG
jgi:hypothetical protein